MVMWSFYLVLCFLSVKRLYIFSCSKNIYSVLCVLKKGIVVFNYRDWIIRFSVARLVQSLIMVRAVEEINENHELGNLTMGYHIVDSCSDVTTALRNTMVFTKRTGEYSQDHTYTSLI